MENFNKMTRVIIFFAYVTSVLHFINDFQDQVPLIETYEGWRFYAGITSLVLNLILILSLLFFFKRIFAWTWVDP